MLFYDPELMNVLRFTKTYNVHTNNNNNNKTYRNNAVLIFFYANGVAHNFLTTNNK